LKRVAVFYHYLYPDQNVSSVHLSELCSGLVERGWDVTAYPSNRNIEKPDLEYGPSEEWLGVKIRRLWRPNVSRASTVGRLLSAAWMIGRWSLLAFRGKEAPDVLVIGTDPILSVMVAAVWRRVRPRTKIAHWCFDLYPEAAYADGLIEQGGTASRILEAMLRPSYASCDLVVDIGPCMQARLHRYGHSWKARTLVPWALSEPASSLPAAPAERARIFAAAQMALMYSGTFGRAHSYEDMLELMELLAGDSIHLAFSVKGQREQALRQAAATATNVSFVPFAAKESLDERLAAPDVHLVSLREEWTGMVIPSKFFGALAAGRPVLFCGSGSSALALWIREYGLGWVLEPGRAGEVAAELRSFMGNPAAMQELRQRCFDTYHQHFSRETIADGWHRELLELVER
jgi:colanic acid biosynthesis glycosyl transferase WcaI